MITTFIVGEKIILRSITYDDTPMVVRWRNNERVRTNFIWRELLTTHAHDEWMRTRVETGEVVQFIICIKESKKPVGSVYLRDIDNEKHEAEYGIFIGEDDAIGKGYGKEAAVLMCRYA